MFRRRARLSAALTCAPVSFPARAGSGALPRTSRLSGASQSSTSPPPALHTARAPARPPPDPPLLPGHPGGPPSAPPLGQPPPGLVPQLHVVMVLSPVIAHEQPHPLSRPRCRKPAAASGRTISDLMKLCSPHPEGTTSQQRSILPVTGRGTVFRQGSKPGKHKLSPTSGHHPPQLPYHH